MVTKKESFQTWYGLSTEKAAFTSMAVGDIYFETDTIRTFKYTQNGWIRLSNEVIIQSGTTTVTNTDWSKKEKPFRGTANFTRPADTTAYTAKDAITNSTSSPSVLELDLSSYGVEAGDFIAITNVKIVTSTKNTSLNINAIIKPVTFVATNDNSELSLSDAEAQAEGVVIAVDNLYTTALNSILLSDCGLWIMQIQTGTSLFIELQAQSSFTPGNADRIDVFVEGVILK